MQFCLSPDLAVEVTLQPVRRFQLDAAILFADILLVPHALGQKLWFAEGEGPRLDPIRDAAGLARLSYDGGKLAPVMQTIKGVRAALPADAALIGFAGAPWTVATYMIEGQGGTDHEIIRALAWREPKVFAPLMDVLVDATSRVSDRAGRCGRRSLAAVRKLGGHGAGAACSNTRCSIPPPASSAPSRPNIPNLPIIGFPRGAGSWLARYAEATGVDGIGDRPDDGHGSGRPEHRPGKVQPPTRH